VKQFLIKYRLSQGTADEWHAQVARFISALDADPELRGRISYRVMKERDGPGYFHLATASDDEAIAVLQRKPFFRPYTEETRRVAGGEVEVVPLELVAATASPA
jgi:hypothetical protein